MTLEHTAKWLETATGQDVVNRICDGFAEQEWRRAVQEREWNSLSGVARKENVCFYRTENGNKCAAGQILDDRDYQPAMEGKTWNYLVEHRLPHDGLIRGLQLIHDSGDDARTAEQQTEPARRFGITKADWPALPRPYVGPDT